MQELVRSNFFIEMCSWDDFAEKMYVGNFSKNKCGCHVTIILPLETMIFQPVTSWDHTFLDHSFSNSLNIFYVLSIPTIYFWKVQLLFFAEGVFLIVTWQPHSFLKILPPWILLTLKGPMFPSYRNQSVDLLCKSTEWFLYDGNIGR